MLLWPKIVPQSGASCRQKFWSQIENRIECWSEGKWRSLLIPIEQIQTRPAQTPAYRINYKNWKLSIKRIDRSKASIDNYGYSIHLNFILYLKIIVPVEAVRTLKLIDEISPGFPLINTSSDFGQSVDPIVIGWSQKYPLRSGLQELFRLISDKSEKSYKTSNKFIS